MYFVGIKDMEKHFFSMERVNCYIYIYIYIYIHIYKEKNKYIIMLPNVLACD